MVAFAMRRLLGIALAAAALLVATAPAAASDGRPAARALAEASDRFDALDYRGAIEAARAVDSDPDATSQQRLEALEIAALSHLILGDERAARAAFEELFEIDPHYELKEETGSPKIRGFFEEAKAASRDTRFAELVHAAPASARSGAIVELEIAAGSGAQDIVEMVVLWRGRGTLGYQEAPFRRREHDRWAAGFGLPASNERWVLEYYVEARDLAGSAIGRVGGPNAPLAIPVEPGGVSTGSRSPWYRRWYVIGAGAAVVGAGVAAGIAAGGRDTRGSLEPGKVTLTP